MEAAIQTVVSVFVKSAKGKESLGGKDFNNLVKNQLKNILSDTESVEAVKNMRQGLDADQDGKVGFQEYMKLVGYLATSLSQQRAAPCEAPAENAAAAAVAAEPESAEPAAEEKVEEKAEEEQPPAAEAAAAVAVVAVAEAAPEEEVKEEGKVEAEEEEEEKVAEAEEKAAAPVGEEEKTEEEAS